MLIISIEINYNIIKIVSAIVNDHQWLDNIHTYKKIFKNSYNILNEYEKILKNIKGHIVLLGLNNANFQEINVYNYLNTKKYLYSLKYIIFLEKQIFHIDYVKNNPTFFFRIYYKYNIFRKNKRKTLIIFRQSIEFYLNLIKKTPILKKYLVYKNKAFINWFALLKNITNDNMYVFQNSNIIYIDIYEINIWTIKNKQLVDYNLVHINYKNHIEIINLVHQALCNKRLLLNGIFIFNNNVKIFFNFKKYLTLLLKIKIFNIKEKINISYFHILNFIFPILYIYSFLNNQKATLIPLFQMKHKSFSTNKYIININFILYTFIVLLFILYVYCFTNIDYSKILEIINNICLVEVLFLTKRE